MKRLALLLLVTTLCSCSTIMEQTEQKKQNPIAPVEVKNCNVTRGVFEIGSISTRLKVAQMDRCQNKITKVLLDREEKIDFQEDLLRNHNQNFSEKFMNEAEETIKKMKAEGDVAGAKEYVAIALEAIREAKNGKPFIEKLGIDLQIDAQILAQQEEAALAFFAASQGLQTPLETTLIWDIGGASQQMIHYKGNNKFATYDGKLGAVTFRNYILRRILRQSNFTESLNNYQTKLAVEYAKQTAQRTVKHDVRNFFLLPNTNIIGIGDILSSHIPSQINPSTKIDAYTKEDVEQSLNQKGLSADTTSRLALVLGYMKALHIEKVRIANVNMTDGLLVDFKYWKP